jgi:hypothetical protein
MDGGFAGSSTNVHRNVFEDVIPELDENMTTIVSMRGEARKPPTMEEIFGRAPPTSTSTPVREDGKTFTTTPVIDIPGASSASKPSFELGGSLVDLNHQGERQVSYFPPLSAPPALLKGGPAWPTISSSPPGTTSPIMEAKESPVSTARKSEGGTEDGSSSPDSTLPTTTSISPNSISTPEAEEGMNPTDLSEVTVLHSGDESMDDIQLTTRFPSTSNERFSKKLAKTFGFKEKAVSDENQKSGELLLRKRSVKDEFV